VSLSACWLDSVELPESCCGDSGLTTRIAAMQIFAVSMGAGAKGTQKEIQMLLQREWG